jgi:ATP-dependent RNA helicase DDX23/PRP28
VIIGTPGRIEDCLDRRILVLNQCFWVILDEADKMIDYNFEDAINRILSCIPEDLDKSSDEATCLL